jgi:hypothetical protein
MSEDTRSSNSPDSTTEPTELSLQEMREVAGGRCDDGAAKLLKSNPARALSTTRTLLNKDPLGKEATDVMDESEGDTGKGEWGNTG